MMTEVEVLLRGEVIARLPVALAAEATEESYLKEARRLSAEMCVLRPHEVDEARFVVRWSAPGQD